MRCSRTLRWLAGAALLAACGDDGPSNLAPTAAFTIQCDALTCTSTNGSTDPDGIIESYAWDFGDESDQVTTRDAAHVYGTSGQFSVTLTVTDDDGETATAAAQVAVGDAANHPPTAGFTLSCTDLACAFTDRSFDGDAGGRVTSHSWDFGDRSTAVTTRDASHTYAAAGQYTVRLTVRDDDGATATATSEARVRAPNEPPTALFIFSCTDLTCDFRDLSVDHDGTLVRHTWDFRDGRKSTETNPRHDFQVSGVYAVELTVTDDRGGTATASIAIMVPAPDFTVTCVSVACTFAPTFSPSGSRLLWRFGDGATSMDISPTHVYSVTAPTTFSVTLYAGDEWLVEGFANTHDITVTP